MDSSALTVRRARDLLVGVDGPVVLVSGRVAHRIAPLLARQVRAQADAGGTPDADVTEVVRALRLAANAYAAVRVTAVCGSPGLPQAPVPRPSVHGLLTAGQVAARLGCKPRNVLDLRARGRLRGEKAAGRWWFDPVEVAELVEERKAA